MAATPVVPAAPLPAAIALSGTAAIASDAAIIALLERGETVSARVVARVAEGMWLIALRGQTLVAATDLPLAPDQLVKLGVLRGATRGVQGTPFLQILGSAQAATAFAPPETRPGDLGLPDSPLMRTAIAAFADEGVPLDPARIAVAVRAARLADAAPRMGSVTGAPVEAAEADPLQRAPRPPDGLPTRALRPEVQPPTPTATPTPTPAPASARPTPTAITAPVPAPARPASAAIAQQTTALAPTIARPIGQAAAPAEAVADADQMADHRGQEAGRPAGIVTQVASTLRSDPTARQPLIAATTLALPATTAPPASPAPQAAPMQPERMSQAAPSPRTAPIQPALPPPVRPMAWQPSSLSLPETEQSPTVDADVRAVGDAPIIPVTQRAVDVLVAHARLAQVGAPATPALVALAAQVAQKPLPGVVEAMAAAGLPTPVAADDLAAASPVFGLATGDRKDDGRQTATPPMLVRHAERPATGSDRFELASSSTATSASTDDTLVAQASTADAIPAPAGSRPAADTLVRLVLRQLASVLVGDGLDQARAIADDGIEPAEVRPEALVRQQEPAAPAARTAAVPAPPANPMPPSMPAQPLDPAVRLANDLQPVPNLLPLTAADGGGLTVLRAARELLGETLLPPKELSGYDLVIPIPLHDGRLPVPARLAVARRDGGGGQQATLVRVDADLSALGPVSVRLSGIDGGPIAITIAARSGAATILAQGVQALAGDLRQAGLTAAIRVVAEDELHHG